MDGRGGIKYLALRNKFLVRSLQPRHVDDDDDEDILDIIVLR